MNKKGHSLIKGCIGALCGESKTHLLSKNWSFGRGIVYKMGLFAFFGIFLLAFRWFG